MSPLDTTPDGWVPTRSWEATKVAPKDAFDGLVRAGGTAESPDDQSMSEEYLRKVWPFDVR